MNNQGPDCNYVVVDISSLEEMMDKQGKWVFLELPTVRTQEGRSYTVNTIAYVKGAVTNLKSFVDNCIKKLKVSLRFRRYSQEAYSKKRRSHEATLNNHRHGYVPPDIFYLEPAINDECHDYECVTLELQLPKVRAQQGPFCIFNAIAYMVELQLKGLVVNVESFVNDYTKKLMVPLGFKRNSRVITALEMIRDQGVIANYNGQEVRVRVSKYECRFMYDYEVFDMIESRTPVMGSFPVREDFNNLGPDIYELNPPVRDDEPAPATHIVMFVGYGERKGRPYLVFLNSYGAQWGTQGLGRVYFDEVYQLSDEAFRFITVEVGEVGTLLAEAPSPPFPPPGLQGRCNASFSDMRNEDLISTDHSLHPSELTHQPDDEPAPRLEIPFRSDPGQTYLAEHWSAADDGRKMFTKNVKYETGYSNCPNTSDEWGDDANITAVTNHELIKSSKAYQDSGISKMYTSFDVITKDFHEEEHIRNSSVITPYYSESVLHNISELCVENEDAISIISCLQKVNPDKLANFLEQIDHGESSEDDQKESPRDKLELLFWVSRYGKTLARTDIVDGYSTVEHNDIHGKDQEKTCGG